MGAFVDKPASGRTRCGVCGEAIGKGVLRVVDESRSSHPDAKPRRAYCHLPCAVELRRPLAHDAVVARETPATLVSPALEAIARLDAALAAEIRAVRSQRVAPAKTARQVTDAQSMDLLAELEASPHERGLYEVLADQLQQLGDERGELITLELAESTDPRRRELRAKLSPDLTGVTKTTWRFGFLRKLELESYPKRIAAFAPLFAHPACRLLEALVLDRVHGDTTTLTTGLLPRSLRSLWLRDLGDGSDLASLPYLEHLHLRDCGSLAHPTLQILEFRDPRENTLAACVAANLPRVTQLAIECPRDDVMVLLDRGGWLAQLRHLALTRVPLELADIERLERGLAGRKLARLELDTTGVSTSDRTRLQALCDVLELAGVAAATGEVWIEHTGKPEWGRGKLVRERDGKLEIAFSSGNRKFKADAPFLRRTR